MPTGFWQYTSCSSILTFPQDFLLVTFCHSNMGFGTQLYCMFSTIPLVALLLPRGNMRPRRAVPLSLAVSQCVDLVVVYNNYSGSLQARIPGPSLLETCSPLFFCLILYLELKSSSIRLFFALRPSSLILSFSTESVSTGTSVLFS